MNHIVSYTPLLVEAWEEMIRRFEKGHISLHSEGDVRCHLFSCCLEILQKADFPRPLKIHAEITTGEKRADIVLGEREVAVEIKYLKKYSAIPTFPDIIKEARKVATYVAKNLVKHAFLAIVDERGTAERGLKPLSEKFESWKTIQTKSGSVTFALCEVHP